MGASGPNHCEAYAGVHNFSKLKCTLFASIISTGAFYADYYIV